MQETQINLIPKQVAALRSLRNPNVNELLYGGGAGGGKAQPLNEPVCTPFGFKPMGDVKVGDVISHPSGTNTTVIAIHPQGLKPVYEVSFSDGASTRCTGDHLWHVWFAGDKSKQEVKSGNKGKVQTTEMLIAKIHKKPIIPLCKPVNFTLPKNRYTKTDILSPYVLGALIGDGGLTKGICFTSIDNEIVDRIRAEIPEGYIVNGDNIQYSITYNKRNEKGHAINPMYDDIRSMGLNCKSEFKFIPKKYFSAGLNYRIALVQGLMDTDGTIDSRGHCSFSSSSKQLALDFQYIVRSLGFKATLKLKKTTHLNSYTVYVQGSDCSMLFHLKRKKDRVKLFNGGFSDAGRRIVSIARVGDAECQCITVDNPDGLYITKDYIVTHNSWLGCYWLIYNCCKYAGTRWVMGRAVLKTLKETTLNSFYDVVKLMGLKQKTHWNYNSQTGVITFFNGSEILLKDLYQYPSDKDFDELGSLEITGAFVDECNQIVEKAWEILKSRIRYKLDEHGLTPKIMGSCNPAKNWVYRRFYKPWATGTLPDDRRFIPALAKDNNKVSIHYVKNLESLSDPTSRARLLKGEWEYDDSPNKLCGSDAINALFGGNIVDDGDYYLTADIARFGSDRAIVVVWKGWALLEFLTFDISKTTDIQAAIQTMRKKYNIPKDRCIADEDGVGGGVVDNCDIKGFVNNSAPLPDPQGNEKENYINLQSQMGYYLAKKINAREVVIACDVALDERDIITEDLEQLQTWKADADSKLRIKPKAEIKQDIGRSPDWRDVFLMRGYFDYAPKSWTKFWV